MDQKGNSGADLLSGFSEDVHTLISRVTPEFHQQNSLRFEHFVGVWQEMKFSWIFHGRKFFRELWEFTEGCLRSVKDLLINSVDTPTKAAYLYLLYSLFFKQPVRPRVKIPLTLSDFKSLQSFVEECQSQWLWDLAYVWVQLINNHSFAFTAVSKHVGLEIMMKTDLKTSQASSSHFFRSAAEQRLNLLSLEQSLRSLGDIHEKYSNMKMGLTEEMDPSKQADPALKLISDKFPDRLNRALHLMHFNRGHKTEPMKEEGGKNRAGRDSIGDRRKHLRERAFGRQAEIHKKKMSLKSFKAEDETLDISLSDDSEDETFVPSKSRKRVKKNPRKSRPTKVPKSPKRPKTVPQKDGYLSPEFAEFASSLEAAKKDPHLLDGLVPTSPSGKLSADSAQSQSPKDGTQKKKKKPRIKTVTTVTMPQKCSLPTSTQAGIKTYSRKAKKEVQNEVKTLSNSPVKQTKEDELKDDDDPLSGIMEIIEEYPPPSNQN